MWLSNNLRDSNLLCSCARVLLVFCTCIYSIVWRYLLWHFLISCIRTSEWSKTRGENRQCEQAFTVHRKYTMICWFSEFLWIQLFLRMTCTLERRMQVLLVLNRHLKQANDVSRCLKNMYLTKLLISNDIYIFKSTTFIYFPDWRQAILLNKVAERVKKYSCFFVSTHTFRGHPRLWILFWKVRSTYNRGFSWQSC